MNNDYQLANKTRKELKLKNLRRDILISDGAKALDMILEAPSPATLIQSFPDQDLYYLMHKIGVHDFIPVLALAASSQWEYILDVEVWDDDRLNTHMITQVFSLLFKADPQRLLRWTITEKPDFIEYYLSQKMYIFIREHDEVPPEDFEDYITLDDKFYFRFPGLQSGTNENSEGELLPQDTPRENGLPDDAPELIEQMIRTLAAMDLSVLHGLFLETLSLLPAETEEEQFRQKNIRLAEKGFLPAHEAVGIYQPVAGKDLTHRPAITNKSKALDPDIPLPPMFFTQFLKGDNLFAKTLKQISAQGGIPDLDSELAALINKVISADRIRIRNRESIEKPLEKTMSTLSLGLEVLMEGSKISVERAVDLITKYFLEDIFRTGSRESARLQAMVRKWYETSFIGAKDLPLSFLGETYLGIIGGLMVQRPMFFANYADKILYRNFAGLSDIRATQRQLDEIICLDDFLNRLNVDIATFTFGVLTYKSMILTLWIRDRMGLNKSKPLSLAPIEISKFKDFFAQLFGPEGTIGDTQAKDLGLWAAQASGVHETDLPTALQGILYALLRELESEYGHVRVQDLDPRFMPMFLLAGQK
ncbi:hypothetical protein DO021_16435 [Desulfobacter hydrogenophilus]|uniref:Uncharacterized protein n=1 Tax=Desulfobacter hydrogenophilus TaxID=2291 RepID=A0A328FB99_9BACT|nr:DUF6178 family protein [Desulfobacter hydrogenophilus]NDY73007.1 hypothetical protein [Desulfobacter hydrogenophilus]QBH15220.1 hypothetical protein EYB58_21245 [Desulfobacter hydrogenophilus]RAM00950.1 hypothetical protein DO021_16435 [Desulfobacter hydrogenophilus]